MNPILATTWRQLLDRSDATGFARVHCSFAVRIMAELANPDDAEALRRARDLAETLTAALDPAADLEAAK